MPLKKEYVTDLRRGQSCLPGPRGEAAARSGGGCRVFAVPLQEGRAQGRRSGWAGWSVSADFGVLLTVPQCFGTWIPADVGQGMPVGGVK